MPIRGLERLTMPVCASCRARSDLARAGWIATCCVVAMLAVVGLGLLMEIVLPWPDGGEARATQGLVVAVGLLAAGAAGLWLGVRFGLRAHAARFFPVSYLRSEDGQFVLVVRDAELAREIASASGQATASGYRAPGSVAPFRDRSGAPDALIVLGVAAAVSFAAFLHAADLASTRGEISVHWLEAVVFDVLGQSGLVASWALCGTGAALVTLGGTVGLLRRALAHRGNGPPRLGPPAQLAPLGPPACTAPDRPATVEGAGDLASILASSTPAAGSTVPEVGALTLAFDPPARLDELLVDGPSGTIATMVHAVGERREHRVPIDASAPGTYVVRWRARVGASDHRGRFSFVVTP